MRWVYELIQNVTDRNGVLQYIQGALYDITERKKAEEGIKKRDSILLAVGFAVEWFLRAPLLEEHEAELHEWGGKTDVQQILEQLGLAVDVSEVSIFKIHSGKDGTPFISMQHEWTAPGVHTYIRNPSFQNFPYTTGGLARWQDELIKGNCISGNIRGLPASEKKFLGDLGFASLAVVPIISKDKVWGFIAFLNKADREWSPEELDGLRIVANIVSMIIGYREREDK
jgi:GAF domain-containing protein